MNTPNDPAWLDRMYNNRALVPRYAEHLLRWSQGSEAARSRLRCHLDVPYGQGPGERLDVFPAASMQSKGAAPVLVFIHGGYWRSLDKSDHSFVAEPFVREGVCVVVPNHDLCPAVTITQITLQMVAALAWTWNRIAGYGGDPARITVAGHSAGGHLACMMLTCDWQRFDPVLPARLVRRALSISGVHDLEPLRHTPFLQPSLRLTAHEALQASPARLPPPTEAVLHAVVGGLESPEFLRQNALIRQAWGPEVVTVCEALPGLNHFSILQALTEPGHRLHRLAAGLIWDKAID